MGKRLKKGRTPPSGNRSAAVSKKVTEQSGETMETAEEAVVAVMEKKSCVHFDKGVNLEKLLEKIKSTQQIKCGECKEGVHVKRGENKGKVTIGKNGFSSSDAKSANKAIWFCLDCGHYVCGGVGLPTGAQSHVMRHIRLTRHRLVIQCEKPQLRWCFSCQSLLPFEKEENGENKDLLLEVVKLIKERSSNTNSASADAEDSCSGSGSITSETKLESVVFGGIGARDGYAVRGLVNLGNTCFFNSVLQNLLSLDQLRYHFLKEDMSVGGGPLVSSLKKLFAETKPELGFLKSVINPKVFFGSVCSKAPQFKGYQQHDSHELLRYLLDSLSIEESSLRKKLGVSDSDVSSTHHKPTLIDSVFGGEISSTVSCLECGHSSKVYEPFLDLSLPVPSKKPAPKKQHRAEKGKIPPKKVLKNRGISKSSDKPALDHSSTVSVLETPAITLENKQSSEIATETDTEFDSFWLDIIGPETSENEMDMVSQGYISDTAPTTQAEDVVSGSEIPGSAPVSSGDQNLVGSPETLMHDNDGSAKPAPDPGEEDAGAMQTNEDTTASGIFEEIDESQACGDPDLGQNSSSANPWADEEELPLMVADSQVLYMPYYQDDTSYDGNIVAESKEGEASSSFVSGHREQTSDDVDFNRLIDEPGVASNDKTVGECEGEASSSFINGDHEENVDYVDFGGLFDEPEVSEGPVFGPIFGPPSRAEVSETGFMAVSSDSDPEELDDSDSPVSVDRCLADFTKPEILSDDNAWHCENCSKNLKLQRLSEKRKTKERLGNREVNENGSSSASDECPNDPSNQTCIDLENSYKTASSSESSNCKEERNSIDDGILVDSETKQPPIASSATETPIGKETISSQSENGNESEKGEDKAVDSEKVIVKRDATKRVLVNKAPPVLTVHLKRFSQDARGRLSKLSGHVDFKEFIDLREYMDSRLTEEDNQPVYRLAGLVEHSGTMRGGHYIAYIRGGHKERKNSDIKEHNSSIWYHASDAYVRRASLEEVLRSEAYILFYERV